MITVQTIYWNVKLMEHFFKGLFDRRKICYKIYYWQECFIIDNVIKENRTRKKVMELLAMYVYILQKIFNLEM